MYHEVTPESLRQAKAVQSAQPGSMTAVAVSTTSGLLIGPAMSRRGLRIHNGSATAVTVSPSTPVVAGTGYVLTNTQPDLDLTVDQFGSLVAGPWYAIAAAGTVQVAVLECQDGG